MDDAYLTLSDISEGLYKEKMSKFLSFAIPVSTCLLYTSDAADE